MLTPSNDTMPTPSKTQYTLHNTHSPQTHSTHPLQSHQQSPPPPASPMPSSYFTPDAYKEGQQPLPPQPTISRGYTAEAVTMILHSPHTTCTPQEDEVSEYQEYTNGEYAASDDDSDNGESWPKYSQEDTSNPFEYIPDPEEDRLLSEERQRQGIASKVKLGYVGRGIKHPISADFLGPPGPTTTFGRTILWPMRVNGPEPSTNSQQRSPQLDIATSPPPIFPFSSAYSSPSTYASTASSASPSPTTAMVPAAQSLSDSTLAPENDNGRMLASTVVTRPARPDEIQALYAAILGRQKVSTEEQEHQSSFQSKGLITRQDSMTGESQSSLCGSDDLEFEEEAEPQSDSTLVPEGDKGCMLASTVVTRPARPDEIQALYAGILGRRKVSTQEQEYQYTYQSKGLITIQDSASGGCGNEGPELKENFGVLKEKDEEVALTAEILLQKKLEELGPCHPGTKRRRPSTDMCEMEGQALDIDAGDLNGEALQHKCQVFDGLCWSQGTREPTLGIYWFHKGERSLRSVHRRFDKFQVMSSPDYDDDVRTRHHSKLAKASTRRP